MSEIERFEAYSPHIWQDGEKIIADNLNNVEDYLSTLSEDYSDFKYNIYQDISSIINDAAANVENAIVQNALKKSSESDAERTMTGDFIIKKTTPAILLRNNNDTNVNMARLFQYMQDGTIGRVGIGERYNKNYAEEVYYLPAPDDRQTDASYQILTTKNPVSIAQGGTGAADATQARVNLGVLPLAGGTMTGNLTMEASKIQFKDTNDNATIAIQKGTGQDYLTITETGTDSTTTNYTILTTKSPVTVAQGGTGVTTTSELREVVGIKTTTVDTSSTLTITFSTFGTGFLVCNGASSNLRSIFYIYSNTSHSAVRFSNILDGGGGLSSLGSGEDITLSSSATGKLKVKNTSSSAGLYVAYIRILGNVPSFS